MTELDPTTVMAADDAWVWAPEGSEVIETAEYRLVCMPRRFRDRLQVQWVRSQRPIDAVVDDVIARASGFGLPEAIVTVKLSAPDELDETLRERGAQLIETADVLAMPLPAGLTVPDLPGFEVRWRTTTEIARDANTVGIAIFGGRPASNYELDRQANTDRELYGMGIGGGVVGYLDDIPVAVAGLEVADGVARLWGGGVLGPYRGRGVYLAMVAARADYAVVHGATMALTQGRVATSSPILRRVGFTAFGQERTYRLPLE